MVLASLAAAPSAPVASPVGSLLVALVVLALILFIGRFVLGVAWRLLRIAIVVVGALWLVNLLL